MGLYDKATDALTNPRIRAMDSEKILPFCLVPLVLYTGSMNLTMTIFAMIILAMSMLYVMQRLQAKKRTLFFFMWTVSSVIYLFFVFELVLLQMLEVTQTENLLFLIFFVAAVGSLYKTRAILEKGKDYSVELTADSFHCPICQIEVNNRYFHSFWLDTCISQANYSYYVIGLCMSNVCLVYGSDLGLTTVCQPYIIKYLPNVLLPEDCSDVYFEFELALCFMACVYSLSYALCITLVLIHQCFKYVPKHISNTCRKRRPNILSA